MPAPDALDGDPLDGPNRKKLLPDPDNATQLTIVQSGRQKDTPNSTSLYDGEVETTWSPTNGGEPWVWLDIGDSETLRNVRWLASGNGEIEISVSSDRQRWSVLDTQAITGGWQEVTLREDAQYVRLTLLPDDDASDTELAEVEVFGRERNARRVAGARGEKGKQEARQAWLGRSALRRRTPTTSLPLTMPQGTISVAQPTPQQRQARRSAVASVSAAVPRRARLKSQTTAGATARARSISVPTAAAPFVTPQAVTRIALATVKGSAGEATVAVAKRSRTVAP